MTAVSNIFNRTRIVWLSRVLWVTTPLSAGAVLDEALDDWSGAGRVLAIVLLFAGWAIGVVALLTPRPRSFTALRIVAPALLVSTVAASTATLGSLLATVHGAIATGLVLSAWVADACTDGASYGPERRVPMRVPPQFALVVVPAAVIVVVVGFSAGPLLLGERRWLAGTAATAFGIPLAVAALRSLMSLERRFVVLVPAGVVVSDSLVLVDPVMIPREHVVKFASTDDATRGLPTRRARELDLRLGLRHGIEIVTDEPAPIPCREGRRDSKTVDVQRILCAPVNPVVILDEWCRRDR